MSLTRIIILRHVCSLILGFAIFHLVNGLVFDDWSLSHTQVITYTFVGLSFPLGQWGSCKKRIKYLESNDFETPPFKDSLSNTIQINTPEFSWKEFESRLSNEFVVTAHHGGNNAFKLRTRLSWFKSGSGAFLTYNEGAGTLKCCYFSLHGYTRTGTRAIQRMNKEIVELAWQTAKS